MRSRLLVSCLLLSILAGCDQNGRGSKFSAAVRDSAGVRITVNRGLDGLGPPGWNLSQAPLLDVGDSGGPPLYSITSAKRLSDGRIVVASAGTKELQIYSPDGRLLSRVGRAGEGPGEFQTPYWVGVLPGDSIAVWDLGLSRLSLFTPAGEFTRSVSPRGALGVLPRVVGVLDNGRVVLLTGSGTGALDMSGKSVQRDSVTVLVLGPDGEISDTIGRFPGTEQIALGSPQEGLLMRPLPFGKSTVVAVQDGRVIVGTGDRYELAAYEPSGRLRALVRAERDPVPVTEEDIEGYRRELVTIGGEGDGQAKRQLERLLAAAPYPKTMPALAKIAPDADGNLWVQDPQKPGDENGTFWTVFSPGGQARGTVRLPTRLNVQQIGTDWVLGIWRDEDDVEHLQLYRLTKGGSEAQA